MASCLGRLPLGALFRNSFVFGMLVLMVPILLVAALRDVGKGWGRYLEDFCHSSSFDRCIELSRV